MAQKKEIANTKAIKEFTDNISFVVTKDGKIIKKDLLIAYLMRCCNVSYSEIGEALNSSRQYAHQLVDKYGEGSN